jgi:hypothetical protein
MINPGAPHSSGDVYGNRQGCCPVVHTYAVQYNTTGISSGILVDTLKASTDNPVQVKVSLQIATTFNAGTAAVNNSVTAGTSTSANEWITTANCTATAAAYYPASNAVVKQRLTADTPIYVKFAQTGTAATTGTAILMVEEFQENPAAIA